VGRLTELIACNMSYFFRKNLAAYYNNNGFCLAYPSVRTVCWVGARMLICTMILVTRLNNMTMTIRIRIRIRIRVRIGIRVRYPRLTKFK